MIAIIALSAAVALGVLSIAVSLVSVARDRHRLRVIQTEGRETTSTEDTSDVSYAYADFVNELISTLKEQGAIDDKSSAAILREMDKDDVRAKVTEKTKKLVEAHDAT